MNRTLAQLEGSIGRPERSDEWDSETCRVFFGAAAFHGFPVDHEHVDDNYSYAIEAAIALDAIPVVRHNGSMHNVCEYGGVRVAGYMCKVQFDTLHNLDRWCRMMRMHYNSDQFQPFINRRSRTVVY
jgi:hypothetical protein